MRARAATYFLAPVQNMPALGFGKTALGTQKDRFLNLWMKLSERDRNSFGMAPWFLSDWKGIEKTFVASERSSERSSSRRVRSPSPQGFSEHGSGTLVGSERGTASDV